MSKNSPSGHSELDRLAAAGREMMAAAGAAEPGRWLLVDVAGQRLAVIRNGRLDLVRPASTALAGIDCRQDSGGTPTGLHRIADKIGHGEPWGTVFRSRRPTGETWSPHTCAPDDDLILTRVLTLEGLQEGHNRGPGVDSRERHIYIHGTNHEDRIGQPVSHGCIRLRNDDVLEVFDLMEAGDPVVIL